MCCVHYSFATDVIIALIFFFFNHTPPTEIYTLSIHDALPICWICILSACSRASASCVSNSLERVSRSRYLRYESRARDRSEEHTSELQSPDHLVCRLLLEKKKKKQ